MIERFHCHFHSTDPVEASQQLGAAYRASILHPHPSAPFALECHIATLRGMRLIRLQFGGPVTVDNPARFDGFAFSLPVSAQVFRHIGDQRIEMSLHEGSAMDATTVDGWTFPSQITLDLLTIASDRISNFLAEQLDRPADTRLALAPGARTIHIAPTLAALFQLVHVGMSGHGPLLRHALAIDNIEAMLLTLILYELPHNYSGDLHGKTAPGASWQVRRAIDFMRANLARAISASDIAAASGLGLRSLQIAFKKQMGVTPTVYLRNLRLAEARLDLRYDAASVTEVAYRWGFASPEQFSRCYRVAFGELPSQTQRRR